MSDDSDDNAIAPAVVNTIQADDFNYDALSMENRTVIKFHTDAIKERIRRTTQDIIEIGERINAFDFKKPQEILEAGEMLLYVKEILEHGEFIDWVKTELKWKPKTIQRIMGVARRFNGKNLTDLKILPAALYYLSAPDVPDIAREGLTITQKVAKSIVFQCEELSEKEIERALVRKLKAQGSHATTQVKCLFGQADVVTDDAIYEIKQILTRETVFQAVGQVLLYRQCINPSARAVIVGANGGIENLVALIEQVGVHVEFWSNIL